MWKVICISLIVLAQFGLSLTQQDSDDSDTGIFPPGCKDEASWCKGIPVRDCYVNNDTCCQTCYLAKTIYEDCPYGDHSGWCEDIHPGLCYRQHENSTCCSTCKRFNTGPQGCEFGDRVSWCKEIEGVCNSLPKLFCCETCKDEGSFNLQSMVRKWKENALQ